MCVKIFFRSFLLGNNKVFINRRKKEIVKMLVVSSSELIKFIWVGEYL